MFVMGFNLTSWWSKKKKSRVFVSSFAGRIVFPWDLKNSFPVTELESSNIHDGEPLFISLESYKPTVTQTFPGLSFQIHWPLKIKFSYTKRRGK